MHGIIILKYITIHYRTIHYITVTRSFNIQLGEAVQSSIEASSFRSHNDTMFSTRDRNNARSEENCATKYGGGWWYLNCHSALLTAPYYKVNARSALWQGIQWHSWKQSQHLKAAQMKIKN